MTDENTGGGSPSPSPSPSPSASPAPSPAPAPSPSPAPTGGAPAPTPTPDGKQTPAPTFKVPDAYKDKPWAAKVKSEEDLYKQIDTLDTLKGKKNIAPDFANATPEEIESYYATTRPKDKSEYKFAEGTDPEFGGQVADLLMKNGVSAHQANAILPAYAALEKGIVEKMTSAEGFKEVMTTNFGEKYDGLVVDAQKVFSKVLTPDQKKVLDVMPNAYLAPLYQLVKSHNEEIAALKKEYGINDEGSAHIDNGGGVIQGQDIKKVQADLRKQIRDIDNKPHTQAEKDELISKLDATYRNNPANK